MKLFTLQTPNGCKVFCSELCFTQCRRAAFKKNKICDWCKHVRHTVNYVDFKDGEQQLQFCSDKCLNQYKMNIFCKETQAHLQMHTHLKEAACSKMAAAGGNLITPELWLRDCKAANGGGSPPEAEDVRSDVSSPLPDSPKPPSPKEKKAEVVEKTTTKKIAITSKHNSSSPKKHSSSSSSQSNKPHRDKKANGLSNPDPRRSPIQATSPGHARNNNNNHSATNGSLLSPPPPPMPRPPPLSLPPRHCPPVPSPLNMEPRQPFLHHNMMPPFQFLAQQQMEAIFRSQHGMDLRSKIPPPFPMPPWGMPPFHPPPPPPHLVPPPLNSKSPSLPHSSPPSRNPHHHGGKNKQKHHKHSNRSSSHHPKSAAHEAAAPPVLPSVLPPVTVMVPFPLVLPIPLPIPVPIPIPPNLMEKFANRQKPPDDSSTTPKAKERKRKNSSHPHEGSKQKKKRRSSSTKECSDHPLKHPQKAYDPIENLPLSRTPQLDPPRPPITLKVSRSDLDADSRSYSPLSDAMSSNGEESPLKNGNFSNFSQFNLVRSSPSIVSERHFGPLVENSDSQSPTNLSVKDRLDIISSNIVNFKKKHLHDQLSLMT